VYYALKTQEVHWY